MERKSACGMHSADRPGGQIIGGVRTGLHVCVCTCMCWCCK